MASVADLSSHSDGFDLIVSTIMSNPSLSKNEKLAKLVAYEKRVLVSSKFFNGGAGIGDATVCIRSAINNLSVGSDFVEISTTDVKTDDEEFKTGAVSFFIRKMTQLSSHR